MAGTGSFTWIGAGIIALLSCRMELLFYEIYPQTKSNICSVHKEIFLTIPLPPWVHFKGILRILPLKSCLNIPLLSLWFFPLLSQLYEVPNPSGSWAVIAVEQLCVEYVVQVRCRELDGSGYWSDWSRAAQTLVQDIRGLWFPPSGVCLGFATLRWDFPAQIVVLQLPRKARNFGELLLRIQQGGRGMLHCCGRWEQLHSCIWGFSFDPKTSWNCQKGSLTGTWGLWELGFAFLCVPDNCLARPRASILLGVLG